MSAVRARQDVPMLTKVIMFIKLTNASPVHRGKAVAIKKDLIVSVYRNAIVRDDGLVEEVTHVFVPPHGTWEIGRAHV